MARNGITPTLVSYNLLLLGLCRAVKVELAFSLDTQRTRSQASPLQHIFYGCCQYFDLEAVYDLWNDMVHHNCLQMIAIVLV
jgi:pentatricopeptide repeat protein